MSLNTHPEPAKAVQAGQREIPYNYTSASDRQAISFLLGEEIVRTLDELRERRVTGRSARLLMKIIGDMLIHRRNPYLYQELVDSAQRRERFFDHGRKDLDIIANGSNGETRVIAVIATIREHLNHFRAEVERMPEFRRKLRRELGGIVGTENVLFDPFSIVAHATDATDWRLHLPVAVVTPDKEAQVAPLLASIGQLGLKVVPRGAGTGLTGGAVPLRPNCVIVNTEKLNRVRGIQNREFQLFDGRKVSSPVIEVEAGVITESAMECAEHQGLVFATDPTSEWACTIGGNIAENAGGKMAVRWGTCIDNLLEWRMAMPSGQQWTVRRTDHQLRKILHEDTVTYEVYDSKDALIKRIELLGTEIRKKGLWKDITNKALGGVPGLQKEGTDGVITSAVFVLYPEYEETKTVCLEFFGPDMDEASRVIVELSKEFPLPLNGGEALLALEHFDDEYIRAIDYKVKAARPQTPKAVLLIDIAGNTPKEVESGVGRIRRLLERYPNTLLFVARDKAEAKRFWDDRKKLSAIARRTNAFKLNEDIVIPIEKLAEFARFIDELNIEEERYWQLGFISRVENFLHNFEVKEEADPFSAKVPAGLQLCEQIKKNLLAASEKTLRSLNLLQEYRVELMELLRGYPKLLETLDRKYQHVRDRRIVLATHMHAGDGNVHVNVPVLSNDQPMLLRADHVIDKVMEKVISLGGVVSGEHGIGVTKLKYLDRERIAELSAYRRQVDPNGLMNPGKLEDYEALGHIFTPSFNLLELEAHILQRGKLEALSKKVDYCIRCGKCKIDCCVYYPARGMFFHPRNKNLAVGSLIEALLYDAQRERSTDFELLQWLEEVADHCTICHKCLKPCPVNIDTGEVSVLEREILAGRGYKDIPAITQLTLKYLDSRSPLFNKVFRNMVVRLGGSAQRSASKLAKPLQPEDKASSLYALRLLRSSVPPVPEKTLRDVLPPCEPDQVLVFEPSTGEAKSTVFYFPGCGSERLNSVISMATIHILLETGTRVILPPPFLCCGFPAHVNAQSDQYTGIVLRNTVMFSQIRDMFSYLNFDACVISCGTCREGLENMQTEKLFGGKLLDVSRYAYEKGLRVEGSDNYLYHAPCHDSLSGKAQELLSGLGGFGKITEVPHCCSEAGTLALSRPDITDSMLARKRGAIAEAMENAPKATILTNCPSCVQGLGRNRDIGVEPKHIIVALAEKYSGPDWKERFLSQASRATPIIF
ncbi:MAG: FAD/FMN-binding oxidoreductase [Chlorobiales bacterium]|nr:FAD/FMN-binding oxidoreductase [Chlorobiales bacterium]